MELPQTPMELNTYLNQHFTCPCGKEHFASLRAVRIGKDALYELPNLVKLMGFESLYLVSDAITYEIAGKACRKILEDAGIRNHLIQLTHTGFDEATLGELTIQMPMDCDLVIAVGTGAINDMVRFFSYRMGRPFYTVATAAPMDGFASSIAAIQSNHLKTTFDAQTPTAIIGDTEILKNAPYSMIAAGLGDLLGKFTCLCDWKLARLINGEHYCERIVELVENCVTKVLGDAEKVKARDPETMGKIMEGLVLAGVAMSLYGNSRPASGCEHHMSHYWEMIFEQTGKRPVPHGTQVGVGTVLILKLVEALRKTPVDFDGFISCYPMGQRLSMTFGEKYKAFAITNLRGETAALYPDNDYQFGFRVDKFPLDFPESDSVEFIMQEFGGKECCLLMNRSTELKNCNKIRFDSMCLKTEIEEAFDGIFLIEKSTVSEVVD